MTDELPELPLTPAAPTHLAARAVSWRRAIRWFEDALRLFKRRPFVWIALAALTVAAQVGFALLPDPLPLLSNIFVPLVACGMLFAAAAADAHAEPRVTYAFRAFGAPTSALVAILLASVITFAAEAFAAWWVADANLLRTHAGNADDLTLATWVGVYAFGVIASLPVTFVPLHVLLEPVGLGDAFAASWQAFLLNTTPLLVYAALSLVLLAFALLTMNLGLVLALPILAASSYTAWRDVFAVEEPPLIR